LLPSLGPGRGANQRAYLHRLAPAVGHVRGHSERPCQHAWVHAWVPARMDRASQALASTLLGHKVLVHGSGLTRGRTWIAHHISRCTLPSARLCSTQRRRSHRLTARKWSSAAIYICCDAVRLDSTSGSRNSLLTLATGAPTAPGLPPEARCGRCGCMHVHCAGSVQRPAVVWPVLGRALSLGRQRFARRVAQRDAS